MADAFGMPRAGLSAGRGALHLLAGARGRTRVYDALHGAPGGSRAGVTPNSSPLSSVPLGQPEGFQYVLYDDRLA